MKMVVSGGSAGIIFLTLFLSRAQADYKSETKWTEPFVFAGQAEVQAQKILDLPVLMSMESVEGASPSCRSMQGWRFKFLGRKKVTEESSDLLTLTFVPAFFVNRCSWSFEKQLSQNSGPDVDASPVNLAAEHIPLTTAIAGVTETLGATLKVNKVTIAGSFLGGISQSALGAPFLYIVDGTLCGHPTHLVIRADNSKLLLEYSRSANCKLVDFNGAIFQIAPKT